MRAEAERLGHLVENVLAYARLERRRIDCHACTATLSEILERAKERLARRTQQAGMELVFEGDETGPPITIHADPSIIEQILVNLVDNACKYAATANDKRIHVQTGREGSEAVLRVRDHGPGIPDSEARGLFRPFSKSAKEAANSAPGIGLGLALCRRLARLMHGDLRYEGNVRDGACFALLLPLSPT
jgi:signal transduction histidine kinase